MKAPGHRPRHVDLDGRGAMVAGAGIGRARARAEHFVAAGQPVRAIAFGVGVVRVGVNASAAGWTGRRMPTIPGSAVQEPD